MRCVILGDGGHARTLHMLVERLFDEISFAAHDDEVPEDGSVIIGVGDLDNRRAMFERYSERVYLYRITPHFYWMPDSTKLGGGVQIFRGAVLGIEVTLGDNVLINTGAQIDHGCVIGDHCVIGPGAILCGDVTLGEACAIGAGAIIVQGMTLEAETIIPAGSLVVGPHDVRRPVK